ncbi:MAG: hypothetical protein ACW98F_18350, partial [Candidatus Hodarchaeales archaeon]
KEKQKIVWKLEMAFFMNNESFLILSFRLPNEDESLEKHYFIISSNAFLEIMKIEKAVSKDKYWVLSLPYSELQQINSKKQTNKKSKIVKALSPYFNKWEIIVDWAHNAD